MNHFLVNIHSIVYCMVYQYIILGSLNSTLSQIQLLNNVLILVNSVSYRRSDDRNCGSSYMLLLVKGLTFIPANFHFIVCKTNINVKSG